MTEDAAAGDDADEEVTVLSLGEMLERLIEARYAASDHGLVFSGYLLDAALREVGLAMGRASGE